MLQIHLLRSEKNEKKSTFLTHEEAYTPKYCQLLELGYGPSLMAEGGTEGIEHMFDGVPLQNKSAIDIGAGLGGVAFYLAAKYDMQITGIEVNDGLLMKQQNVFRPHFRKKLTSF